jgi:dTDP-4-dehydrorhamnose reductase
MKVLLFGANGQVGYECGIALEKTNWEFSALTREHVDFSYPEKVYETVKNSDADIVVNACAYTNVDKAESDSKLANLVNAKSVGAMAKACAELNIPTIHISTDYVFNGAASKPYKEIDPVAPMGIYGETKLAGEALLQKNNSKHIILRTSWVFSAYRNNFVKTMLRLGRDKREVNVVTDQFGCPTHAGDIAATIISLIKRIEEDEKFSKWGIYNCSNTGDCNWFEFAKRIFEQSSESKLLAVVPIVLPITSNQYSTVAKRPAYSVLNGEKLKELLGKPMPHWDIGLAKVCNQLINNTEY